MTKPTLLVVHGTGVRSESFEETLKQIRLKVKEFHLPCVVEPLLWGETLGIDFEGLSLPYPPDHSEEDKPTRYAGDTCRSIRFLICCFGVHPLPSHPKRFSARRPAR